MRFLSKAFRRGSDGLPSWAALDQENLRISAAMEHVQQHGNLDAFPGNQQEKLALMMTASRQGLVTWDREHQKYELTKLGRERLGMHEALRDPGPMNLPASASGRGRRLALGTGTLVAGAAGLLVGATAMALIASSSKSPPRDRGTAPPVATTAKPADQSKSQTSAKPLDQSTSQQTSPASPSPPPQQQAAQDPAPVSRNPGIPCLAGKCLETGGTAAHSSQPSSMPQQPNNPPSASSAAGSPPPTSETPKPSAQSSTAQSNSPNSQQGDTARITAAPTQPPSTAAPTQTPSTAAPTRPPPSDTQPGTEASPSDATANQPKDANTQAPQPNVAPSASESSPAKKPKSAERKGLTSRSNATPAQAQERPTTSEQAGYGQAGERSSQTTASTAEKSAGTTAKSRSHESRQAAHERRRDERNRRDHAREDRSRRDYARENNGAPVVDDPGIGRFEEGGRQFLVMPRREYERRYRDREPPSPPRGYAYEDRPPFGSHEQSRQFGPFDWLFH